MSETAVSDAGRVVLVTGAGKGIGRALAEHLARRGVRVVVNNRSRDGADSAGDAVAAIRAAGGEAIADRHDVRESGAAEAMAQAALGAWGRLDAVVLNAGVSGPADRFAATPESVFRDVLETNFFANLAITQAALPHVAKSPAGRLLFVSSSAGLYGVFGRSAYAASKGALVAWALSLAHELKRDKVGVNVIAPYATTQMTQDAMNVDAALAAQMAPERVAPVASWLLSAACAASGQIWVAGGGKLRRARMMEGRAAAMPDTGADEWLAAHAPELEDMREPRGFVGAEEAFADFLKR